MLRKYITNYVIWTVKACVPDLLSSCLLKLGAEFIAPSLTHLFQLSISSGKLPLDWISADVVPVH